MPYVVAVIDVPPVAWDPPPRRPHRWPAWAGATLSLVTTLAMATLVVTVARAAGDSRYAKSDVCRSLDIGPLAVRLGVAVPEPEKSLVPSVCRFPVTGRDGLRAGLGSVQVAFFRSGFEAWLSWQTREQDDRLRAVDGIGRSALVSTEEATSGSARACAVHLQVLDANVTVRSTVMLFADLASRPCDDLGPVTAALIDSTRATLARLA